jgi:hypothetical protein
VRSWQFEPLTRCNGENRLSRGVLDSKKNPSLLSTEQDLAAGPGPQPTKAIIACPDENIHAGTPCLVAMEPDSGFLPVETSREHRDAATWTLVLRQATADLAVQVVLLTSDEAKGLLGCAEHGLAVIHGPDLFHQCRRR